jgi:hypothetical protein
MTKESYNKTVPTQILKASKPVFKIVHTIDTIECFENKVSELVNEGYIPQSINMLPIVPSDTSLYNCVAAMYKSSRMELI